MFSFGFDFREASRRACVLELQLKNTDDPACPLRQRGIHFTHDYNPNVPGKDGWDTVSATVDQFSHPDYFCPFDPRNVYVLVLNVQMLEKSPDHNVLYVGSFDHIQFRAPGTPAPGETAGSLYSSANDFFWSSSIDAAVPIRLRDLAAGSDTLG